MSAYAHQMEQQYSAHSLTSTGGSEMGSRYQMESGFYMTSFVATLFIAALLTVGLLLITLLIALTVMLQSCQSKSGGVVEVRKPSDSCNHCRIFSLHAELNSVNADEFPSICRDFSIRYVKEGQYARDLDTTVWLIEDYFSSITRSDDGLDVVLMDIDDVLPLNPHDSNLLIHRDGIEEAKHLKAQVLLRLYMKLRAYGWPLILLSRKPERQRNATVDNLLSAEFNDWLFLILRSNEEMNIDSYEYFSRKKSILLNQGFRLTGVISSYMDALTGPYLRTRIFKLPNPIFYSSKHGINEKEYIE